MEGQGKRTYLLASCTLQGGEKKEENLESCAHVCVEDRERTVTICEHLSQLQHTCAEGRDTSHQRTLARVRLLRHYTDREPHTDTWAKTKQEPELLR